MLNNYRWLTTSRMPCPSLYIITNNARISNNHISQTAITAKITQSITHLRIYQQCYIHTHIHIHYILGLKQWKMGYKNDISIHLCILAIDRIWMWHAKFFEKTSSISSTDLLPTFIDRSTRITWEGILYAQAGEH